MQKIPIPATMIIVVTVVASMAGILLIGGTVVTSAYGQIFQQPPIASNDECLPGSAVHCIDHRENPPNSNEGCLSGSAVHCIDDRDNSHELFEFAVHNFLDNLFYRLGVKN
ncbi:MAG TPA: hypothetical protein VJ695_06940 [Nitrososphaera sp.]|nr:hypothetical protein [Nitrososphaera sp.]